MGAGHYYKNVYVDTGPGGGCVLQQRRERACTCLWVNAHVVGYGHRPVDMVLVVQVIIAAVGIKKKKKLSCVEGWWLSTQAMRSGGAGLNVD